MFDDVITDIKANTKLSPTVTELFLTGIKLNILLVFISQSYSKVPRTIKLNATHYFIMKIPNKAEVQQIASNHSTDIEFKDFRSLYKDYTKKPLSLFANETSLPSDNPLRFKMNLLQNDC